MSYVLFGSYPNSGGWNDYYYTFDSLQEARAAAVEQLEKGCSAYLLDRSTDRETVCELVFSYDGLGVA